MTRSCCASAPVLYEMDSTLHLKPLLTSPTELEQVEISPDGKLLVVESELEKHTPEEHERLAKRLRSFGLGPPPRMCRYA